VSPATDFNSTPPLNPPRLNYSHTVFSLLGPKKLFILSLKKAGRVTGNRLS